jgi:hypothetical protein
MTDRKPTSAKAWKKQTHLVELPSGNVAELRRINIMAKIDPSGNSKQFLAVQVASGMAGQQIKLDPEAAAQSLNELNELVTDAFVSPELVLGAPETDDQLALIDLDQSDYEFVLEWVMGGEALNGARRFPDQSKAGVPAGTEGGAVEDATG